MNNEQSLEFTFFSLRIIAKPSSYGAVNFDNIEKLKGSFRESLIDDNGIYFPCSRRFFDDYGKDKFKKVVCVKYDADFLDTEPLQVVADIDLHGRMSMSYQLPSFQPATQTRVFSMDVIQRIVPLMTRFLCNFFQRYQLAEGIDVDIIITDLLGRHIVLELNDEIKGSAITLKEIAEKIHVSSDDLSCGFVKIYPLIMGPVLSRLGLNHSTGSLVEERIQEWLADGLAVERICMLFGLPIEQVQKLVQPQKDA